MNVLAALVAAACGVAVWLGSGNHLRSPYLRGLLVALTVLCLVASQEAVATTTNVSWYMIFAVFWLLLWRPATTRGATLAGLFIIATPRRIGAAGQVAPIIVSSQSSRGSRRQASTSSSTPFRRCSLPA